MYMSIYSQFDPLSTFGDLPCPNALPSSSKPARAVLRLLENALKMVSNEQSFLFLFLPYLPCPTPPCLNCLITHYSLLDQQSSSETTSPRLLPSVPSFPTIADVPILSPDPSPTSHSRSATFVRSPAASDNAYLSIGYNLDHTSLHPLDLCCRPHLVHPASLQSVSIIRHHLEP